MNFIITSDPTAAVTVQGLFSQYQQSEILEGENAYSCDICKTKVTAERWTEIQSPPAHMFVVLNRFSWDVVSGERRKEKTHVEVEESINVWGLDYLLYAAVMHQVSHTK